MANNSDGVISLFEDLSTNRSAVPIENVVKDVIRSSKNSTIIDFYAIVIDAGSTGSRAFICNIIEEVDENLKIVLSRSIHSMKGKKIAPGLSDYVSNITQPDVIVDYILPIFISAAEKIPMEKVPTTKVFIKGTAGMRLLPEADQSLIWNILYEGLNRHPANPFKIDLNNLGTISGHLEAYYAVVSSNYIEGAIDANMRATGNSSLVGALDLGGSSTQLIFYVGNEAELEISPKNFWSHSWINFGVDKIREKLLARIVETDEDVASDMDIEQGFKVLNNPCFFRDFESLFNDSIIIRGTGDSWKCLDMLEMIIWPDESCTNSVEVPVNENDGWNGSSNSVMNQSGSPCFVDGIEHPPIRGHFYGMSVYFFAIDCVRHLGSKSLHSWPTPTIHELEEAIHEFCATEWKEIERLVEFGNHKYTFSSQLPHRCLEALYITTLLEKGFGFDRQSRNITIALEVNGKEVEWTLGYALTEIHGDHSVQHVSVEKTEDFSTFASSTSIEDHTKQAPFSLSLSAVFGRLIQRFSNLIRFMQRFLFYS